MLKPAAVGFPLAAALAALLVVAQPTVSVELTDSSGRLVAPFKTPGLRAAVFVFTRTDCPISNRYAPEIGRLFEKFAPQDIGFWLVYVDPAESSESVRRHLDDYGYAVPALLDPLHRLVKASGAVVTPEAAVFLPDGQLVYRGRIDNRYVDFGQYRPKATEHDLDQALESVAAGKPIGRRITKAVGCFISDLR